MKFQLAFVREADFHIANFVDYLVLSGLHIPNWALLIEHIMGKKLVIIYVLSVLVISIEKGKAIKKNAD